MLLALSGAALVPVALRWRWPVPAAVLGTALSAVALFLPEVAVAAWTSAQVCLLTAALRASRTVALALAVLLGAVLYGGTVAVSDLSSFDPSALVLLTWTAAVVGAGLYIRGHADYVEAVHETARAALAARESEAERRVSEERLRIARDLHDSVAHGIAVVNVQAGAAERSLNDDPEGARRSLEQVRAAARAVLGETQHILSLLRRAGGAAGGGPSITDPRALGDLVASSRALGTPVRLTVDTDAQDLDPAVRVALYRILQEALTNAHRHGDGPVDVSIGTDGEHVRLEAVNTRATDRGGRGPRGYGLAGMRERAASVGGGLDAGPAGRDFRVVALLPLRRTRGRTEE